MSKADSQAQALQIPHLDQLCRDRASVTLYLVNGIRLQGTLFGFDDHTLLLSGKPTWQLVYKHAISSVLVIGPSARR